MGSENPPETIDSLGDALLDVVHHYLEIHPWGPGGTDVIWLYLPDLPATQIMSTLVNYTVDRPHDMAIDPFGYTSGPSQSSLRELDSKIDTSPEANSYVLYVSYSSLPVVFEE